MKGGNENMSNVESGVKIKTPRSIKRLERVHKKIDATRAKMDAESSVAAAKREFQNLKLKKASEKRRAQISKYKDAAKARKARTEANANRRGLFGHIARKQQKKMAKHESELEMIKMEPKLSAKERVERLKSETEIKKTKAKGAAYAGVATALGSGYAQAKKGENEARIKEAEAEISVADALRQSLNSVHDVGSKTPEEHNTNITGMIAGVR